MYDYCYSQMDEDGLCTVCTACSAPTFTNLACDYDYMQENPGVEVYRGGTRCYFEIDGVEDVEVVKDEIETEYLLDEILSELLQSEQDI